MTQSNSLSPFHIAVPVNNLPDTQKFYGELLGCIEGRSTETWIDWDFFGHQLSTHVNPKETGLPSGGGVDGKTVPCRHFGVILSWAEWHDLEERLKTQTVYPKIDFIVDPYIRFKGQIGEQATMFFLDSSQNALEFKSFKDTSQIFEPYKKAS